LPANRTIDGYSNLTDSNCNFCKEKCEKLDVTAKIGFFDGFKVSEAVWFIGSVIVFSILYQLFINMYRNPKILKEYKEVRMDIKKT